MIFSAPGSYRLTGNLVSDLTDQHIIEVTAPNVTLDLNGFEVVGPNGCSGDPPTTPVTCTHEDFVFAAGIAALVPGLTVKNGTVRGAVHGGILFEDRCRVVDVTVRESRTGIAVGERIIVNRYIATLNLHNGIDAGFSGGGVSVTGSSSSNKGWSGFSLGVGVVAQGNVAWRNAFWGFWVVGGTLVANSAVGNGHHGFRMSQGHLTNNTAHGNGGFGLTVGATVNKVAYSGSVFTDNDEGTASGAADGLGTRLPAGFESSEEPVGRHAPDRRLATQRR